MPGAADESYFGWQALFCQAFLNDCCERRDDLVQIANHAKACQFEDRCFWILIDGYDQFTGPHTGQVLDGA